MMNGLPNCVAEDRLLAMQRRDRELDDLWDWLAEYMEEHGLSADDVRRAVCRVERLGSPGVEPNVIRATVRDADDELHIECRFSDCQKFAAVRVDSDFPELANRIASFLSANTSLEARYPVGSMAWLCSFFERKR
jgi:hypothetical protein